MEPSTDDLVPLSTTALADITKSLMTTSSVLQEKLERVSGREYHRTTARKERIDVLIDQLNVELNRRNRAVG